MRGAARRWAQSRARTVVGFPARDLDDEEALQRFDEDGHEGALRVAVAQAPVLAVAERPHVAAPGQRQRVLGAGVDLLDHAAGQLVDLFRLVHVQGVAVAEVAEGAEAPGEDVALVVHANGVVRAAGHLLDAHRAREDALVQEAGHEAGRLRVAGQLAAARLGDEAHRVHVAQPALVLQAPAVEVAIGLRGARPRFRAPPLGKGLRPPRTDSATLWYAPAATWVTDLPRRESAWSLSWPSFASTGVSKSTIRSVPSWPNLPPACQPRRRPRARHRHATTPNPTHFPPPNTTSLPVSVVTTECLSPQAIWGRGGMRLDLSMPLDSSPPPASPIAIQCGAKSLS